MIFKAFFLARKTLDLTTGSNRRLCKVFAVENGQQLENRIATVINNLKADGYDSVELDDCWNISEPSDFLR